MRGYEKNETSIVACGDTSYTLYGRIQMSMQFPEDIWVYATYVIAVREPNPQGEGETGYGEPLRSILCLYWSK